MSTRMRIAAVSALTVILAALAMLMASLATAATLVYGGTGHGTDPIPAGLGVTGVSYPGALGLPGAVMTAGKLPADITLDKSVDVGVANGTNAIATAGPGPLTVSGYSQGAMPAAGLAQSTDRPMEVVSVAGPYTPGNGVGRILPDVKPLGITFDPQPCPKQDHCTYVVSTADPVANMSTNPLNLAGQLIHGYPVVHNGGYQGFKADQVKNDGNTTIMIRHDRNAVASAIEDLGLGKIDPQTESALNMIAPNPEPGVAPIVTPRQILQPALKTLEKPLNATSNPTDMLSSAAAPQDIASQVEQVFTEVPELVSQFTQPQNAVGTTSSPLAQVEQIFTAATSSFGQNDAPATSTTAAPAMDLAGMATQVLGNTPVAGLLGALH